MYQDARTSKPLKFFATGGRKKIVLIIGRVLIICLGFRPRTEELILICSLQFNPTFRWMKRYSVRLFGVISFSADETFMGSSALNTSV